MSEDGEEHVASRDADGQRHHRHWQRLLQCARAQGHILAVCSKNSAGAFAPFTDEDLRRRTGVLVGPDDFAAISTAWDPKSSQLAVLSAGLIRLTAVLVRIAGNGVELAEVNAARPEISTLPFPSGGNWAEFCRTLSHLTAVVDGPLTQEDRRRAQYYALRYQAETARAAATDIGSFLASLDMKVEISQASGDEAVDRSLQLLNRANRCHLTGNRFDETTWRAWARRDDVTVLTARLVDRFGDHGVCAVLAVESAPGASWLCELAMSCRVVNRGLEHALTGWMIESFPGPVRTTWTDTGKNAIVRDMLAALGFGTERGDLVGGAVLTYDPGRRQWHGTAVKIMEAS